MTKYLITLLLTSSAISYGMQQTPMKPLDRFAFNERERKLYDKLTERMASNYSLKAFNKWVNFVADDADANKLSLAIFEHYKQEKKALEDEQDDCSRKNHRKLRLLEQKFNVFFKQEYKIERDEKARREKALEDEKENSENKKNNNDCNTK